MHAQGVDARSIVRTHSSSTPLRNYNKTGLHTDNYCYFLSDIRVLKEKVGTQTSYDCNHNLIPPFANMNNSAAIHFLVRSPIAVA